MLPDSTVTFHREMFLYPQSSIHDEIKHGQTLVSSLSSRKTWNKKFAILFSATYRKYEKRYLVKTCYIKFLISCSIEHNYNAIPHK